jgi:hypothetical protein
LLPQSIQRWPIQDGQIERFLQRGICLRHYDLVVPIEALRQQLTILPVVD